MAEAVKPAKTPTLKKFEKFKAEKDGLAVKEELEHFAQIGVGLHVPIGRLYARDMLALARIAQVYGNGEIRLTVEQNLIIPNIPDSHLV